MSDANREDLDCPVCMHDRVLRGIPCNEKTMIYQHPYGPMGQQITRLSGGWYKCFECHLVLNSHEHDVLMDAVTKAANVKP